MTRFPKNAGMASGVTGGLTFLIVSGMSYSIVNGLPAKDEQRLAYSYLIVVILSVLVLFLVFRKDTQESGKVAVL